MNTLRCRVEELEIGQAHVCSNLAMFPLIGPDRWELEYLLVEEALASGLAEVKELSPTPAVGAVELTNKAGVALLLLDGEQLAGAKQNRIVNITVLAPPLSTLAIPVTCMEAGRWSRSSAPFRAAGDREYAARRAMKHLEVTRSLHVSGAAAADQGAAWADIDAKACRLGAQSPTRAMDFVFAQYGNHLGAFASDFVAVPGQVGAIFTIEGMPVGLDVFDRHATLEQVLPKLVRSYALDAIDRPAHEASEPSEGDARALIEAIALAPTDAFSAVGMGESLRLRAPNLAGAALVAGQNVVHLAAFVADSE